MVARRKIPKKIRLNILKSQDGFCKVLKCGRYLHPLEFHIDHDIPLADGGKDELSNMRAICIRCHMKKTSLENKKRMTGSIRTSKAEQAMGLPKWIPAT